MKNAAGVLCRSFWLRSRTGMFLVPGMSTGSAIHANKKQSSGDETAPTSCTTLNHSKTILTIEVY